VPVYTIIPLGSSLRGKNRPPPPETVGKVQALKSLAKINRPCGAETSRLGLPSPLAVHGIEPRYMSTPCILLCSN
jgi:hypothetical protein